MLWREANATRQMAAQPVFNGIVPDLVALLRQLTSRLNHGQFNKNIFSDNPLHEKSFHVRAESRWTVVDALKLLPLRNQVELITVLRCLSDAVSVTHELNEATIVDAVDLLRDITSQADTLLKFSSPGINYDLDPMLLTLTVKTASSVMTALAESNSLFGGTKSRDGFYRKISTDITTFVNDMIELQLRVQSIGELPIHVKSPFMSIHAFQLSTGHHKPIILDDVQFQLPYISQSLLQQWSYSSPLKSDVSVGTNSKINTHDKFNHNNTDNKVYNNNNIHLASTQPKIHHDSNLYNDGDRFRNRTDENNISDRKSSHGNNSNTENNNNNNNNKNNNSQHNNNSIKRIVPSTKSNKIKDRKLSIDTPISSTRKEFQKFNGLTEKIQTKREKTRKGHRFVRDDSCFQTRSISFHSDPNNLIPGEAGKVQTAVASLDLYSCDGSERLHVKDLPETDLIQIDIQRQYSNDSMYSYPHYLKKTDMNVHELMPGGESGPLLGSTVYPAMFRFLYIHIQLEPIPSGQLAFPLLVLISPRSVPHNRHTYIFKKVFNSSEEEIKVILPVTSIEAGKSYSVGLSDARFNSGRRRSLEVKGLHYNLSAWWDTCVYWDDKENSWKNEGCKVLETSTIQVLRCSCNHLTSFGGFFDLIPHQLTALSVDEFFSLHENLLILVMLGTALLAYLVLALMIRPPIGTSEDARRCGRVVFLQDHCPSHRYKYEVIMETGFHPDSGTTSKVSLILHGDEGVSETRELTSTDNTTLFERNSMNRFIITLPESPGRIFKIQLWHNNSGSSPSWFLRQVVVRDVNSGQIFYFLCQKWLAVDRDDGKVEREFTILDGSAMTFSQVFVCKGSQFLSDLHTWLSVFTCPSNSHFTRAQRLFLCLTTLMSYMGLATMWFHLKPPGIRGEFGLLDLSWKNIVTGAAICFLMFPVNLALTFLFRRSVNAAYSSKSVDGSRGKSGLDLVSQGEDDNNVATSGSVPYSILDQSILNWQHIQEWAHRQWQKRQVHIISSTDAIKDTQGQQQNSLSVIPLVQQTMLAGEEDTELGSSGFEDATSQATAERNRIIATSDTSSIGKKSDSDHSSPDIVVSNRKLLLPSWCRYIAWVLCFLIAVAGAVATVWYGFRFSHRRSVMWVQTVYFSLITSIFIVQPLVVLLKTLCISLRHSHNPAVFDIDRDVDDVDLDLEERRYHEMNSWQEEDDMQKGLAARSRSRYLRFAGPIQENQLKSSRRKLMKEKRALTLLRLGSTLIVLSTLLAILLFGRKRGYQINLHQAAHEMFAGSLEDTSSFMNIKSIYGWHRWSKQVLVPSLSSLRTLSKESQKNTSSELGLIVGNVQLRQFRVRPEPCVSVRPLGAHHAKCHDDYSGRNEDESYDGFGIWQFGTDPGLWGHLAWYGRDGFVLPLSNTRNVLLNEMEDLEYSQWLDHTTRAVMVEMTIYNPPSQLYSSITLLMEVSASGKVIPSTHIRSSQLFHYVTLWEDCLLAFELILLVIIIVMLSLTTQKLFYQRSDFFKQFWNYVDITLSLTSLLYIVLYVYRFVIVMEIVETLRSTFYEKFVSFAFLTLWDETLHTVLGLMLFCVMLQWIRVCSYNPTIARLIWVYKKSRREIVLAAGLFVGQVLAFSSLGNVLFGIVYYPMHSFLSTAVTISALSVRILRPEEPADSHGYYMLSIFFLFTFVFLHGFVGVYIFSVLAYKLKGSKIRRRFSMPPKKLVQFYWRYFWERARHTNYQPNQEDSDNTLSPEFIMAEILYLVDELLFRMNNLLGTSGLPEKQHSFSDSDSTPDVNDDGISTGGSEELHNIQTYVGSEECDILDANRLEDRVHRIEDKLCSNEPYLAQLLKLDSFGANILSEEEEHELRSKLEFEIFQQLQKQRQETNELDLAALYPQTKLKLESPKIISSTLHRETKDTPPSLVHKAPNNKIGNKQLNASDNSHVKLHSPKRLTEVKSPEFFPDGEMKALMKVNSTGPAMNTKSLKRSQSLKVPARDTTGIFETSPYGSKKARQGCIIERDIDNTNVQTKMLVNRHSSVKGKKELMAFDRFVKKDANLRPIAPSTATSILKKIAQPRSGDISADVEKDQTFILLSHKMSSGNISPQSSSEGERGHKRTDSSSGQSGLDTRLDTPKMIGKRLDLPPRPTFTHNAINLSPHKVRPLDLVGGEWTAAESSSGSEQEAGLGGHKRMSSTGRRNLRKTKSRGKGKGDDVDINSAIVLSENFNPTRRQGGLSDCSIIIHPVPANVELDEISIPEEL